MSKYSVEEVRLAARVCGGKVGDMLDAYAERIKADARPVAQGEVVAGARIRRIDGAVVYDLALTPAGELLPDGLHQFYTTPPAQPRAVPDGWSITPEPNPLGGKNAMCLRDPSGRSALFGAFSEEVVVRDFLAALLAAAPSQGEPA